MITKNTDLIHEFAEWELEKLCALFYNSVVKGLEVENVTIDFGLVITPELLSGYIQPAYSNLKNIFGELIGDEYRDEELFLDLSPMNKETLIELLILKLHNFTSSSESPDAYYLRQAIPSVKFICGLMPRSDNISKSIRKFDSERKKISDAHKYRVIDETFEALDFSDYTELQKNMHKVLKMPDPVFIVKRLLKNKKVGLLSKVDRSVFSGKPLALVSEKLKSSIPTCYFGLITIEKGQKIRDIHTLNDEYVDGITYMEFLPEKEFYFHRIKAVDVHLPQKVDVAPRGRKFFSNIEINNRENDFELSELISFINPDQLQSMTNPEIKNIANSFISSVGSIRNREISDAAMFLLEQMDNRNIDAKKIKQKLNSLVDKFLLNKNLVLNLTSNEVDLGSDWVSHSEEQEDCNYKIMFFDEVNLDLLLKHKPESFVVTNTESDISKATKEGYTVQKSNLNQKECFYFTKETSNV